MKSVYRLYNIDLIKGFLILSVLLGHILQGRLEDELLRTIIYSFHMPLFIGVAGFLFKKNNVEFTYLKLIFDKYIFRVITPWVIAVLVYFFCIEFIKFNSSSLSINNFFYDLIKSFIYPYYHLWFIVGFLSYISFVYVSVKLNLSNIKILIISFFISVVFYYLRYSEYFTDNFTDFGILSIPLRIVVHSCRLQFLFFFVLGFIIRDNLNKNSFFIFNGKVLFWELIFISISFLFVCYLFYNPNELLSGINFYLLNTVLILFF